MKSSEFEVYTRRDIEIVSGTGARVKDSRGREYIDCIGGIGVASLGHGNRILADALKQQAEKIISVSNHFYNDKRTELAEKLTGFAPDSLNRVFFCNSGTESIEAAIKFARYATKKHGFVCAERSFHGRTMGALSATFKEKYREPFKPLVPGFDFAEYNNFESFKSKINQDTAAVIIELVQGEGGIYPADKTFIKNLSMFCRENNILIIIDEVQTGVGRTGTFFTFEQYGIVPDIVTLAKGLGGGVPIGAVLVSDKIPGMPGRHGSTFGGNPFSCAAAVTVIDYIKKEFGDEEDIGIMCHFIGERKILAKEFKKAKIYSSNAHAEGVDLSHLRHFIIYSSDYSGAKFIQRRDRIINTNGSNTLIVNHLLVKGAISEQVYKRVSKKEDFNNSTYIREDI